MLEDNPYKVEILLTEDIEKGQHLQFIMELDDYLNYDDQDLYISEEEY